MARFNDDNVPAAIQPHLQPGEQLQNWAYGVKQPHVLLIALTGAILTALLTKSYIVALTDRRLLVLRFEGTLKVTEVTEYPLSSRPQASGSRGMLFTHLRGQVSPDGHAKQPGALHGDPHGLDRRSGLIA
jgi:hypothetical protein